MEKKILVVEDEYIIRKGIIVWLESRDFRIEEASDGEIAIEMLSKNTYDVVILDLMLPKVNGLSVLKFIREKLSSHIKVIILSAKDDEEDKILGLELGADDYISKPFSNRELEARINANLRTIESSLKEVKGKYFDLDLLKSEIHYKDSVYKLSKRESELLKILMLNKNKFVEKDLIREQVWGYLANKNSRTVDIHVSKIRTIFEEIGLEDVIKTKRNGGYMYVE